MRASVSTSEILNQSYLNIICLSILTKNQIYISSSLRFPTIATELSWRYITSFSDSCKRTIYVLTHDVDYASLRRTRALVT
ncbi:hypothetical protein Hdeb2414_s0002g00062271 [Helianthus debilis subsp. tardiflorus]